MTKENKQLSLQQLLNPSAEDGVVENVLPGISESRLSGDGELLAENPTLAMLLDWEDKNSSKPNYLSRRMVFFGQEYLHALEVHNIVLFTRALILGVTLLAAAYIGSPEVQGFAAQHELLTLFVAALIGIIGSLVLMTGSVYTGGDLSRNVFTTASGDYLKDIKRRALDFISFSKLDLAADYSFEKIIEMVAEKIDWGSKSLREKNEQIKKNEDSDGNLEQEY